MTLIAAIAVGNIPVLIGDILLTADGQHGIPASTPLIHNASPHLSGASVVGLFQKIVIPHKHICVAWAGQFLAARNLLGELEQAVQDEENISATDVAEALNRWQGFDRDVFRYVVYWIDAGQLHLASNFAPTDINNVPPVRVEGSGTQHFLHHAEHIFSYDVHGTDCSYEMAVNRAFSYIAQAATDEIERAEGIARRWGGGFEVAALSQRGFAKVDKILWLRWVVISLPDGLVLRLEQPYMFQYYRDGQAHFFVDEDPNDEGPRHYVALSPTLDDQDVVDDRVPIDPEVVVCLIAEGTFRRTFVSINAEGSEPEARIVRAEGMLFPQFSAQFLSRLIAGIENASGKKVVLVDIWDDVMRWT